MNIEEYIDLRIKWFFISRFIFLSFGLFIGVIAGVCFVIHWIYKELILEASYRQKYGADWHSEFEKYHGSLAHAHTQLIVSTSCMLALVLVLAWFCRQTFHKHKRHIYKKHAANKLASHG